MTYFSGLRLASRARLALTSAIVFSLNAACYAQSCALCYTQAAGAGHRFIEGLRTGILVLIVPPMFMSVGITILAYRKRNRTTDAKALDASGDGW